MTRAALNEYGSEHPLFPGLLSHFDLIKTNFIDDKENDYFARSGQFVVGDPKQTADISGHVFRARDTHS